MGKHDPSTQNQDCWLSTSGRLPSVLDFEAKDPISSLGLPITHNLMNHHLKTQYWASNGLIESKMGGRFYLNVQLAWSQLYTLKDLRTWWGCKLHDDFAVAIQKNSKNMSYIVRNFHQCCHCSEHFSEGIFFLWQLCWKTPSRFRMLLLRSGSPFQKS